MIGSLRGKIIDKKPPKLLIEVHGVGYEVAVSMQSLYALTSDQDVFLWTHLVVRQDVQELYGFGQLDERSLFRHLIRVNGVGPKLALSILSSKSTQAFATLVLNQNSTELLKIPGVGKKMAERLILEMVDRIQDLEVSLSPVAQSREEMADPQRDAISALVSLGYKQQQAKKVVLSVAETSYSSETIIREALKYLAG